MGYEVNFDGIVGPTHNYSGLSWGNVASLESREKISNPKEAALQGLKKMKFLHDLGLKQAVFPPHERPHIPTLRSVGYTGNDAEIIKKASKENPELFHAVCSAAPMWTANMATVTPSADTHDKRLHFTPANLTTKFHRSIEPVTSYAILKAVFANEKLFTIHPALPQGSYFSDEGAANHTRFCNEYVEHGVHLFVYGRHGFNKDKVHPKKYPARQTLEAFQAIARFHGIPGGQVIYAQQNPEAIDSGVFHNDVISVGNRNIFFYHEKAFVNTEEIIAQLKHRLSDYCDASLALIKVTENDVAIEDAVSSYLFNSQIVTLPNKRTALIAPTECEENENVKSYLDSLGTKPFSEIYYINLRESMCNGGGPACLRLRVVLTDEEINEVNPGVFLTDSLYQQLTQWVEKHYRDRLSPKDLCDPNLLIESQNALDELSAILKLGSIYPFQTNKERK